MFELFYLSVTCFKKIYKIRNYLIKFRKHGDSFGDHNSSLALEESLKIKQNLIERIKMNKISIRLTSFLLAIFSYVLIFQNIVSNQEQIPLNTNEQFEINIANTLITKEELALELDKIVDTNNATLIKIDMISPFHWLVS
mgnify:CR=1 FL=1